MTTRLVKVAAVQAAPVFFDIEACLDKADTLVEQASKEGCQLVAFGEAWFPGYPFHIWLGAPAWGMQFVQPYFENSVEQGTPQFERLCGLARKHGIMISAGISERATSSLYLSQVLISAEGEMLSLRRKLKPTHVERSVYGEGYGEDLAVVETVIGNVGQLCCWEHLQPLSKYAMYSQNEQIHVAAWPSFVLYKENAHALGAEVNMSASQVYAVEGQCFVIAASTVIDQAALDFFKVGSEVPPFIELGGGSSMVFAPDGRRLAEFLPGDQEGLVFAELDMSAIIMAKAVADPAGHYSKPEATQLVLHREPRRAVIVNSLASGASNHDQDEAVADE